jgi:hypothetical protein
LAIAMSISALPIIAKTLMEGVRMSLAVLSRGKKHV